MFYATEALKLPGAANVGPDSLPKWSVRLTQKNSLETTIDTLVQMRIDFPAESTESFL